MEGGKGEGGGGRRTVMTVTGEAWDVNSCYVPNLLIIIRGNIKKNNNVGVQEPTCANYEWMNKNQDSCFPPLSPLPARPTSLTGEKLVNGFLDWMPI